MAKTTLVIRHLEASEPPEFEVTRLSDGKRTERTTVPSPIGFPVEGRPNSDLLRELRWYLEDFLTYPFPPETDHAERVQAALRQWGEETFEALFEGRRAGGWFDTATADNYSDLNLRIQSDDPRILAWPWEALRDPEAGAPLAHSCRVERRLNNVPDPRTLPDSLPKDRVNILLVVARPYGDKDVRFRSIARPLIDLIEKGKLPAHVELLRPPTFAQLDEHLKAHPGHYHIVHFDGHGSYGAGHSHGNHHYQGPEGQLVFEKEDGSADPVSAEKLNTLLREYAVPGVVLNACQSAMISAEAKDPFASVAASLVRAGMRSVVAMAYSLYVSGAQKFLPPFYEDLFETGDFAEAVRAGRRAMLRDDKRICARGEFPLQDWLLPVTYQQQPIDFSFAKRAKPQPRESKLPKEIGDELRRSGFIGRDSAVLEIERALRRAPAGILIEGMGGVGKTTLARGFLDWLDKTNGLGRGCIWFGFQEIRTADFVLNRLGENFFGTEFATAPLEQRIDALAGVLRDNRLLIVWDNFESASGIEGTSITANLSEEDRASLRCLLEKMRGGESKVLITSRSPEKWLSHEDCYRLSLRGLDGEERWEYCQAILRDLGLKVNREDPEQVELMDFLRGHPLAMRMVLPKLAEMPAGRVVEALRSNVSSLGVDAIGATVRFIEQGLPEELRPLLVPLGMHEGFVDARLMEMMAKQVGEEWTRERIDRLFSALLIGGLLWERGQGVWEMHPVLSGYLRSRDQGRTGEDTSARAEAPEDLAWQRAFVDVMGRFADAYPTVEPHKQRFTFSLHGTNLHYALGQAARLGMVKPVGAITQALATQALDNRDFASAARLYQRQAEHSKRIGIQESEASAYHQLGLVAEQKRDFIAAKTWYQKALEIREDARTHHQLGSIAQEQRDYVAAEEWYQKSLAIKNSLGDKLGVANTHHQLGMITQAKQDFVSAEKWYLKALRTYEELKSEQRAAVTYHQLGRVAEEKRDLEAAEEWFQKALVANQKLGSEYRVAACYHQLGIVAFLRENSGAAEESWLCSLQIREQLGDARGTAATYGAMGNLAQSRGDIEAAGKWFAKSISTFRRVHDLQSAERIELGFFALYESVIERDQSKLQALWEEGGLGDFPEQTEGAAK